MLFKLLPVFLALMTSNAFSGSHALLLIGNMSQQDIEVDGETFESDRYLAPGVGYLFGGSLAGSFNWELGASYIQRKFGYEKRELTLPTLQIPLGIRFSVSRFAVGAGVYYWKEAGEAENSKGDSGSFNDLGYKDSGNGAYLQVSSKIGPSSYIEIRSNIGTSEDSDIDDVKATFNDYQIIYGFVLNFGSGGSASSGADLGDVDVE